MKVTAELIDKLANLAMLEFNEEEKMIIQNDLQNMIALVNKLQELNTDDIEPLMHLSSNNHVLREDLVKPSITNTEALLNAPIKQAPFFAVPKIIKK